MATPTASQSRVQVRGSVMESEVLTVVSSVSPSVSMDMSHSVVQSASLVQASMSTFVGSTIMIASNIYISTVIDLGNGFTTVTMLPMTTMIASITQVGSMIWMDSFMMIESEVLVVSFVYVQVPHYLTMLSRISWIITAYTSAAPPTVSNALLIGAITGVVILLFGFTALIIWFARKRKAEELSWDIDDDDFNQSVVGHSAKQRNQEEVPEAEPGTVAGSEYNEFVGHGRVQRTGFETELDSEDVFMFDMNEGWEE
jgi:hypothetical protein